MLPQESLPAMVPQNNIITTKQMSLDTCALEIAYSQACGHFDVICESETARHLRLQILLLENDNNELYNQLAQADGRIDELEDRAIDEQEEWETALAQVDSVQKDLRTRNREVETLKVELTSMCGVKTDSTRLLTEKLNLARDLSNLKPELDHLRSQNSAFQSLLSDKLSLERQLSTLQVEIENERRSKQRLTSKESKSHAGDEADLEALRIELAKERREKSNADREAQKSLTMFQNKVTMYESRLDAFRGKLKSTKESLKEVQVELQKYQASSSRPSNILPEPPCRPRNSQKRAASEIDADTMIGTPGDLAAGKSKKAKSTMLGEKSTFSTTPFLSRTANMALESPSLVEKRVKDLHELPSPSVGEKPKIHTSTNPAAFTRPVVRAAEDKNETNTPVVVAERNKKLPARRPLKKAVLPPKLPLVAEEVDTSLRPAANDASSVSARMEDPVEQIDNGFVEKKKVKRKVLGGGLGKTLFDEDDGEVLKGDRRIGAAGAFTKQRRGGLGEAKLNPGASRDFAPFSPLKRDRRVVAA